jgi:hypothetical protein
MDTSQILIAFIGAVIVVMVAIIGYFISRKLNTVDQIAMEWKMMSRDIHAVTEELKAAKPKFEAIVKLEGASLAAFAKIDALRAEIAEMKTRCAVHHTKGDT